MTTIPDNINYSIGSHPLIGEKSRYSSKVKKVAEEKLVNIENGFNLLQSDLECFQSKEKTDLMTIDSSNDLLSQAKEAVTIRLADKKRLKNLLTISTRIEALLLGWHNELQSISPTEKNGEERIAKVLREMRTLAIAGKKSDLAITKYLKLEEEKLGSASTLSSLKWLQRAQGKLFTQKETNIPQLMKRIDDLEQRLLKKEFVSSMDFTKQIFEFPTIELKSLPIERIGGEERGASDSYYIKNSEGEKIGVFKPTKGDAALKPAVPQGESQMRQLAAFIIDKENGSKANVAFSMRATYGDKPGALQTFQTNQGCLTSLNPTDSALIPAKEVHNLALLRTRLYDLDTNSSNILWRYNGDFELVSIDHDYCLPVFNTIYDLLDPRNALKFTIQGYPQMERPFDKETLEHIFSWDIKKESDILRALGFPIQSINLFKTMSWFHQEAAKTGLDLDQILSPFLSVFYTGKDKYKPIQEMIKLQDKLLIEFSDPEENYEDYSVAFETEMKKIVLTNVRELRQELHLD